MEQREGATDDDKRERRSVMEDQDDDKKTTRETFSDGMRQGLGILSAVKDAIEETIQEARDRGDISADRAKEVVRKTLDRAQEAAGGARERFDFVSQSAVDSLEERIAVIEAKLGIERPEPSGASEAGSGAAPEAETEPEEGSATP
jgi:polyhydroxyalkanoate synthesis regulator phasin